MPDSYLFLAAALPGSGDTVQVGDQNKDPLNATEKVPFKEQVIGKLSNVKICFID